MKSENISAINCPIFGIGYFALRPYLWLSPLLAALISFVILSASFVSVAYMSWPESTAVWLRYTWGIFKSLGYASFTLIALWVFIFPIILSYAFENMIGKILHDKRIPIKGEGPLRAVLSSLQIIFRTFGWRLFWPMVTLVSLFFFGPLSIVLAQIGMGHIAMIDGIDLSLSVQGFSAKRRIKILKSRFFPILTAGLVAGVLSMILTATIVGWLFWLPGIYVGCTLWTLTFDFPRE